ncbi:MAG: M10 family metallopeptidase C-terminal domain-containing protein [Hyphomicrobiales bacterium]|nr:M10 family metallopeptidase C-terminal domain-containing protein [Hyphomicrobiales bacterium]
MAIKPVWTDSQIISQLDSGLHWSGSSLTFGFPANANWFPYAEKNGFSEFSAAQKSAATLAVKLWDDLMAPDFTQAANGSTAHIKFSNTTTDIGYAHAYFPGGWAGAGSVWLNPAYGDNSGTNNLVNPTVGKWGFQAYVHEIGHALGINHPGTYNGGAPTYDANALYAQDSLQYTVMSYFTANNTGADWVASDGRSYYAQTPMLHDVMTIQAMYGVETTTRSGDTTYGFNSSADVWVYNFSQNLHPIVCIYDAGGTDTLDLSGWSYSAVINLAPGSYSHCDMMTYNVSIAYNTWIENAVGGAGADTLVGSTIANSLDGRAGSDTLTGAGGNDIFVYGVGYGADVITDFSGDVIDLSGMAGVTGFADVLARAAQVGANTVINFGSGNTLTLQNVGLGTLASAHFSFDGTPMTPNAPPTAIALATATVSENAAGATVGALSVTDPNGDTAFTFQVSDARFQVAGSPGAYSLKLVNGVALDFETEPSVSLTIVATDAGGLSISRNFVLSVVDAAGVTITGTSAANTIDGTRTIAGQGFVSAENDAVYGMGGNDVISGLGGHDYLRGDAGNDTLKGDAGNDRLEGGVGTDALIGGADDDTLILSGATDAADLLNGGDGIDAILVGGTGALTLNAFNAAASSIEVWQGNGQGVIGTSAANVYDLSGLQSVSGLAYMDGGSGKDRLTGSQFANDLRGGAGNDTIDGGAGDDILTGGSGADSVNGGGGDDTIVLAGSDAQSDTLSGGQGNDSILVLGSGNLTLLGFNASAASVENWQGNGLAVAGTGAANVFDFSGLQSMAGLAFVDGGNGNDTLIGSQFADDLRGGAGNDWLFAGDGNDSLSGGTNNDTLIGGAGRDILSGGTASDSFVFTAFVDSGVGSNADVIADFSASQLDKINLTALDANTWTADNDAFSYIGNVAFTGVAGQLRFANGVLMADRDGDGVSDFEIVLSGVAALSASGLLL